MRYLKERLRRIQVYNNEPALTDLGNEAADRIAHLERSETEANTELVRLNLLTTHLERVNEALLDTGGLICDLLEGDLTITQNEITRFRLAIAAAEPLAESTP